ncbi:MAG: hypothetical protein AAGG02_09555, partial [Cyanobacteria bacterium P01_H01_bin.15]
ATYSDRAYTLFTPQISVSAVFLNIYSYHISLKNKNSLQLAIAPTVLLFSSPFLASKGSMTGSKASKTIVLAIISSFPSCHNNGVYEQAL